MQLDVKFNEAVICDLRLFITFYHKGHNDWIFWLVTSSNISVEATLQCIIGAPETRAMVMRKLRVLWSWHLVGMKRSKTCRISQHFPHPMLYFRVLRPVKPG